MPGEWDEVLGRLHVPQDRKTRVIPVVKFCAAGGTDEAKSTTLHFLGPAPEDSCVCCADHSLHV